MAAIWSTRAKTVHRNFFTFDEKTMLTRSEPSFRTLWSARDAGTNERTNELETEMSNLPDNFSDYAFDLYNANLTDGGITEAEEIDDWRAAALSKFADLIEKSFRDELPHIVTHAKLDLEALVAFLSDGLIDFTYEIQKELENE
jgi:hypothetical protein